MNTFRKIILALLLFFSCFLGSASASYVTNGLVAQYDWLQDSGSNVIDVSGTGNNGTNSGSVLVDIGNGHKYRTFANASSQYISVPTSTSLNFTTAFTIEVWCKPSVYQDKTKNVNVLAKENTFNLQLGGTSGASVFVLTVRNATGYNHFGGAYVPIQNNNWHQLVATYNGTTRNVVLYDDTSVFSSTSGAAVPTSINLSSSPLVIGAFSPTYGFFNGSIALVRIYNRSLSADEVEINFNNNFEDVYTFEKESDNIFENKYITEIDINDSRFLGLDSEGWYAASGNSLKFSSDAGVTWETVFTDSAGIQQFHKFSSGRILVTNYIGKVFVSDTNGENFQNTFTMQNAPIVRSASAFGISVNGSKVWLGDYSNTAQGSGRYIYASEDEGQTWSTIFDAGIRSNFHIHDVKYDPYENIIWAVTGDGFGNHFIHWSNADNINWFSTTGNLIPQFTQIIPMPDNVLFVTDNPTNVRIYRFDRPQAGTASVGSHVEPRPVYTIAKTWSHEQAAYGTTAAIKYGLEDPYAVFGCIQINNHQEIPVQLFSTSDGYVFHKIYDSGNLPTDLPYGSNIGVLGTYTAGNNIYASVADGTYKVLYIGDGLNFSITGDNLCAHDLHFTDLTLPKKAEAFFWDFESDGTIDSTSQNPVHQYTRPGTYNVNFTVQNEFGTFSTVKEVVVKLPFSVEVSEGTVLYDVQVFEAGRIVWKESSDDHSAVVRHILPGFPANTLIQINRDGVKYEIVESDSTGTVTWTYDGGFSEHTFEAFVIDYVEVINTNVNSSIWQTSIGMILVAVVVFFGTMLYQGIKKGKVESDTIILAAKGLLFIAMTLIVGAIILSAF